MFIVKNYFYELWHSLDKRAEIDLRFTKFVLDAAPFGQMERQIDSNIKRRKIFVDKSD